MSPAYFRSRPVSVSMPADTPPVLQLSTIDLPTPNRIVQPRIITSPAGGEHGDDPQGVDGRVPDGSDAGILPEHFLQKDRVFEAKVGQQHFVAACVHGDAGVPLLNHCDADPAAAVDGFHHEAGAGRTIGRCSPADRGGMHPVQECHKWLAA